MKKIVKVIALLVTLTLMSVCAGCNQSEKPVDTPSVAPVQTPTEGDTFLSSGFKIKSEIRVRSSEWPDPLVFEVYVDEEGDGAGLVGYRDNVYDVYLVGGQVYVGISNGVVVHLTDVTARMIPAQLQVAGVVDLKSLGFSTLKGSVVSYEGSYDAMSIASRYETSVSTFEPVAIAQSNNMTSLELLKYFFDNVSGSYVEPSDPIPDDPERQSFYINSEFGVVIRGITYSLGDFCEPYTYFERMIPQGMNSSDEYREDEKVTFLYVSYISSDGGSMFMTTDGYVQAIHTTSEFSFLDAINKGMTKEELEPILGIGLKKDELENFVPLYENLVAAKSSNGYTLTLGDMTIELEMGKKEKTLQAITVTNYLDFRS